MNDETKSRGGSRTKWVLLAVLGLFVVGGAGYRLLRGPSGATELHGGSIEAKPMPALPADAHQWVNGEPITIAAPSSQVLLVEGWHPA